MNTGIKFGLLALTLAATVGLAEDAPKIHFDRMVYDFGATSLVESVTGTFTYQNTGGGLLQLQKPKPSCGCTVAKVSSDSLKPGEKGELVFTIALGAASGVHLRKEINLVSNDPQTPSIQLEIKVATKAALQALPPGVSFGDIRMGSTTNTTILVKRIDGRKLTVTKVETLNETISAKIEPATGLNSNETRITIAAKAEGLPRRVSEQVRIYTEDSQGAALSLFASARFLGDIKLEPEALVWGMPLPEQNPDIDVILSRTLQVSATKSGSPLVLRNLSCSLKEVKLELETVEKGKVYQIEAKLSERLKESLHGTIRFETNLPSLPKVEVPIDINVWKD